MIKSSFNRFLVLFVGLLTMCVTQVWATDYMLTFEGTGTFPYNSDWTVECTENTSYNHTTSGSKCGSFNFSSVKYITYKNALTNVKSISFWTNRTTNNTTNPTFTLEGSTNNGSSWSTLGVPVTPNIAKNTWGQSTITLSTPFTGKVRLKYSCSTTAVKLIDDITITTQAATICTVTFDAGSNGTCSTANLTEASAGAGVTLPSVTAKTGYRFVGWSTSSTPTSADAGEAGDTYKPSSNCQLYAYYIKTWDVKWYVNGTPTIRTVDNGSALSIPDGIDTDIECSGKVFVGWCTSASYSNATTAPTGMFTSASGTVDANANYYAVYATASAGGGESLLETVGFESSEGYTATSTYNSSNYTTGSTGSMWTINYGAFSTSGAIVGSQSAQFRVYSAGNYGQLRNTVAYGSDIKKVVFNAKVSSTSSTVKISYSTNGTAWTDIETKSLTTSSVEYTSTISASGARYIKFTAAGGKPSSSNWQIYIDAVKIYTSGGITYSNYVTTCGPATYTASVSPAPENGSIK